MQVADFAREDRRFAQQEADAVKREAAQGAIPINGTSASGSANQRLTGIAGIVNNQVHNSTNEFSSAGNAAHLIGRMQALDRQIASLAKNSPDLLALQAERQIYANGLRALQSTTPAERAKTSAASLAMAVLPNISREQAGDLVDRFAKQQLDPNDSAHRAIHDVLIVHPRIVEGLTGNSLFGYDGGNSMGGGLTSGQSTIAKNAVGELANAVKRSSSANNMRMQKSVSDCRVA